MSKFDPEHKLSVNNASGDAALQCALSALPALAPTQDRLNDVLRALAKNRESDDTQQATLRSRRTKRSYKTYLIIAAAACFMASVTALLLRQSQPSNATMTQITPRESPTTIAPHADSEIAQLIAASQQLEAGLRNLGEDSASFSQLYGRKQAELSLATLDTQLAKVMASNSEPAISQQRALWRERVAVLSAVENGNYRQALFVVD